MTMGLDACKAVFIGKSVRDINAETQSNKPYG